MGWSGRRHCGSPVALFDDGTVARFSLTLERYHPGCNGSALSLGIVPQAQQDAAQARDVGVHVGESREWAERYRQGQAAGNADPIPEN